MKTLISNNVNDNILGKTYKALEKQYTEAAKEFGVVKAKCVLTSDFDGLVQGAVLGFDKNDKVVAANAFSTYCGKEMAVMVKVHKFDYLIYEAMMIQNKLAKAKKYDKITIGSVTEITL